MNRPRRTVPLMSMLLICSLTLGKMADYVPEAVANLGQVDAMSKIYPLEFDTVPRNASDSMMALAGQVQKPFFEDLDGELR